MISFVKGIAESISVTSVVIDNNGIGYEIFVSPNAISNIRLNEEIKLYTYFQVKEDGMSLYGFLTREELKMFNMLISVSGIGPKSALNMLSQAGPKDLMLAIISDDVAAMSKFPGIGKKTAGRLILELKDKIKTNDAVSYDFGSGEAFMTAGPDSPKNDAIDALTALGYSRSEAVKAVISVYEDDMDAGQIIKLALKAFSQSK